jgi:hypothetical protein
MERLKLFFYLILGMLFISGCNVAPFLPASSAAQSQAAPITLPSTVTSEALIPAGWATHTSQQCEYAISYPPEMEVTDQNPYSKTFRFKQANPDEGARNFIYVSVIAPEIQDMVKQGTYNSDVYNYVPAQADMLLNMQVGESKSLAEVPNYEASFTYQRQPDTMISDQIAQTYENVQPWEFPGGTKEIRYYLSLDGCTYLIGGYMDTTGSNQPGAITEDLFHQIAATVQLIP